MERLLPLDRRFLQPAPKGLGDPKGEVELVPDAWTVFEQDVYKRQAPYRRWTCLPQSLRW